MAGLRSIAEKLSGHWEGAPGWVQRMRGVGRGCTRDGVRLRRRCWLAAESCEVELERETDCVVSFKFPKHDLKSETLSTFTCTPFFQV